MSYVRTAQPTLPQVVVLPEGTLHALAYLDASNTSWSQIDKIYQGTYARADMYSFSASAETIVEFGFDYIASVRGKTSSKVQFYLWSIIWTHETKNDHYTDEVRSALEKLTWGVGIRIVVACWDVKGEVDVSSPKAMAAAASAGNATTLFDIEILGGGLPVLESLIPVLSRAGSSFGMNEMHLLQDAESEMITFFSDRVSDETLAKELVPALISADVDFSRVASRPGGVPTEHMLAAAAYALERGGWMAVPLKEALADKGRLGNWEKSYVDPDLVKQVYDEFLWTTDPDKVPVAKRRELAKHLLYAGR